MDEYESTKRLSKVLFANSIIFLIMTAGFAYLYVFMMVAEITTKIMYAGIISFMIGLVSLILYSVAVDKVETIEREKRRKQH